MIRVEKAWGYEIWFANNELYCGKEIVCRDGIWSSEGKYHYHPIKDETFWVIDGELLLDIVGEDGVSRTKMLGPLSKSIRIKPGIKHRFRSVGGYCKFIEVSTTHREEDSIRVD